MQTPIKALLSLWWVLGYRCWSKTSWLSSCSIIRIHIHQPRTKQSSATAWTSTKDAHSREDSEVQRKTCRQDRQGPQPSFELRKTLHSDYQGTCITADLWWLEGEGPPPASSQQWKQTLREALIGDFSHLKKLQNLPTFKIRLTWSPKDAFGTAHY